MDSDGKKVEVTVNNADDLTIDSGLYKHISEPGKPKVPEQPTLFRILEQPKVPETPEQSEVPKQPEQPALF
ncbi:hypothetical protein EIG98_14650, partial [Staphylococcus condimenti]